MKDKIKKWMKRYWALACMAIGVILLAISGSFAAYTSFNSVKRVVSTGKRSDTMFGSNYLTLVDCNLSEAQYTTKRISPAENNGNYTFILQVCNYVYGNESTYNPKSITYTLTAQVKAMDGGALPENVTGITIKNTRLDPNGHYTLSGQTLSTGAARTHEYTFSIPADLKDKVKIQIDATPDDASKAAVNDQKLAGVIAFSSLKPTENWTGHFLDDHSVDPDAYDAFNYEISGNGEGTVILSWPESLQISKWFVDYAKATSWNNNSCTFKVGGKDDNGNTRPTAYQLQFYRNPDSTPTPTPASSLSVEQKWKTLESTVVVRFTPAPTPTPTLAENQTTTN